MHKTGPSESGRIDESVDEVVTLYKDIQSEYEQTFRTLFNNTQDAILLSNSGVIVDCNPRAEVVFGFKREEMIFMMITDLSPDMQPLDMESRRKTEELNIKALRGIPLTFEWTYRRKDGNLFEAEVSLNRVKIGDDYLLLYILHDVTRRKDTEAELRYRIDFEKFVASISTNFINLSTNEIDRGIRNTLEDVGTFADVDRSFIYLLNDEKSKYTVTHEWCNYGIASLIERNFCIPVSSASWLNGKIENYENVRIADVSILPSSAESEKEILQSAGVQSILCVPLYIEKKIIGFFGFDSVTAKHNWTIEYTSLLKIVGEIIANALERKYRENQTLQTISRYRALFEDSKDGVFVSTEDGRLIAVNQAGIEMLGYDTPGEIRNVGIADGIYKDPGRREEFQSLMKKNGYVKDFEAVLKRKNGMPIFCLITATAFEDKQNNKKYYQGFIRNVTDQRELEKQTRQTQKMESLGQLAGGIAHDFNNVLGIVQAILSAMRSRISSGNPDLEKYIEMGENAVSRGGDVARRLLTFSQDDEVVLKPLCISEIVKELVSVLNHTIEKDILIEKQVAESLPPFMGDHGQIYQMLLNLCINARDAIVERSSDGPEGYIRIAAEEVTDNYLPKNPNISGKGRYLKVSVEDNGTGMPDNLRERIFDPFFTTKSKGRGTGLGLSVVYGIVQSHGGYMEVQSKENEGTVFNIYLQSVDSVHIVEHEDELKDVAGGNETILIVEDEDLLCSLMEDILIQKGYKVITASDGIEALCLYREKHSDIDAVILDMGLPKIPGQSLFLKMMQIDRHANIIFATGYVDEGIRSDLLELGAKAFVQKPYKAQEILRSVREVLDMELNPGNKYY